MPKYHPLMMAVVLAGLAGCASLSEDECRSGNWNTIGFNDGSAGRSVERLDDHREACADYGIAPDLNAYINGRERGLLHFCQPSNGYRVGLEGRTYEGVCPGLNEKAFLVAYRAGLEVHELRDEIEDKRKAIKSREREIEKAEDEVAEIKRRPITATTDVEALKNDLLEALSKPFRLRREIEDLELDISDLEKDLENLLARHRQNTFY